MTIQTRSERSQREAPEFDLGGIAAAVQHLDSLEADDPSAESQLRALMFSVPEDHLGEVREILNGVKNTGRFQNVAAAFYARWAEIDPEAAYLAAAEAGAFSASARRGVLMTWLNIEPEVALARLLEDRKPADLGTLSEFIDIKAQHAPRDAAELVDHLAEKWPEADKRLFPKVATTWALIDPVAAGEWVESYWDRGVRNRLLRSLSQKIASGRGSPGMALADRIDDPEARSEARMNAARWWGISQGGFVFSEKSNPEIQLIDGFPDDWTENEIRSLALGMMANASKSYPDLIGIAKDEKQSQAIYEGVINGASFSQPALVVDAVAGVDPQFAATPAGKKALTSFILRWNENDAGGAKTWLASQPPNPKTQLMRKALTEKANP